MISAPLALYRHQRQPISKILLDHDGFHGVGFLRRFDGGNARIIQTRVRVEPRTAESPWYHAVVTVGRGAPFILIGSCGLQHTVTKRWRSRFISFIVHERSSIPLLVAGRHWDQSRSNFILRDFNESDRSAAEMLVFAVNDLQLAPDV